MHLNHQCCKSQRSTQLRQRYNPTFVHEPIFLQETEKLITIRCTPTFHSTALSTEGYNIKTVHARKQRIQMKPNTVLHKSVYSNFSHERRIQDLNPKIQCGDTKEKMLGAIRNCNHRGCSRERQYLNLLSDPVFTDFDYGIEPSNIKPIKIEENNPQNVSIEQVIAQAPVQKEVPKEAEPPKEENQHRQAEKATVIKQTNTKSTKKDFHQSCIPQYEMEASRRATQKIRRPQTVNKGKVVSLNPTFTVVRGNKISNRL